MAEASLRETLNASITAAESGSEASPPASDAETRATPGEPAAPVQPQPGGEEPPPAEPPPPAAEPPAAPAEGDAPAAEAGAKRPLRGAALAAAEAKKAREAADAAGIRPPESWKPAIRDKHWKTLPPAVQAEIHRRERQVDDALKSSAEARRGVEVVGQLFNQYKDVLEYEGAPPLQTVNNLLSATRTLRFSPPPQKAQAMAQLIQGFGIDLQLLDQALAYLYGNAPQANPQVSAVQQVVAQQLAPVQQYISEQQRQQQQQAEQNQFQTESSLQNEINQFASSAENEYFEYVRDAMADILETAAHRGHKVTLQEAYHRACLGDNNIAQQYLSKKAQAAGATAAAAAAKAGMSVTGSPAQGDTTLPPGADVRAALNAAWAKHAQGS